MTKFNRLTYVLLTAFSYGFFLLLKRRRKAQQVLFDRLSELGGVYVKFLQLLVLEDTFNEIDVDKYRDILAVYDQVRFEPIDITTFLAEEFGVNHARLQLDSELPFAAGSFAQVYSGKLDGENVIIKVLRPSVTRFLKFDLHLLGVVTRIIDSLGIQGILDLPAVVKDFKNMTLQEIDYRQEAESAQILHKQLSGHPVVYIPQTYAEFCSRRIITQEKIEGVPLTALFNLDVEDKLGYVKQTMNTDVNYVMEKLAVVLLEGSLSSTGAHGDPHPGNIYLLPNNRLALIDFGIRDKVQKHQGELLNLLTEYVRLYKGDFRPDKFAIAMISFYVPELTTSIQTLSAYFGKKELLDQTLADLSNTVSQTMSDSAGDVVVSNLVDQYRMTQLFMKVMNRNNRYGLKLNIETPTFIRSSQIFMLIIRKLDCDMQVLQRAWQYVIDEHKDQQQFFTVSYDGESVDDSVHVMAGWLDRLCYSDPRLYNEIMKTWGGLI